MKLVDIIVWSNFKEDTKTWTVGIPLMIIPSLILSEYLITLKQKNGIKLIQMNPLILLLKFPSKDWVPSMSI